MKISDAALIALVQSHGTSLGELFFVGTKIYVSEDGGDFHARSTYSPFPDIKADEEAALISLLRHLRVPTYETPAQVNDALSRCKEWEDLYFELRDDLSKYGVHIEGSDGDFLVVDQDYGYPQVKVEFVTPGFFGPEVLATIQGTLARYQRRWEVVLSCNNSDGSRVGYLIYSDAVRCDDAK